MAETGERARRRPYHHGDLRNALIDAGVQLLMAEGVHALDLRKVARLAGVSHAAPYRHFQDKQALLLAIVEEGFRRLGLAVTEAIGDGDADPATQLLAMGTAYVLFAVDQPAYFRLMFNGSSGARTPGTDLYRTSKTSFHLLLGIIQRGQELGQFAAVDPELLAKTVWSMVHGLATLIVEDQFPLDTANRAEVEQLTQRSLELVYTGLERRV
jgi:AcrR family transcriptional regulator